MGDRIVHNSKLNIRIETEVKEFIDKQAKELGLTISELIRILIKSYFKK